MDWRAELKGPEVPGGRRRNERASVTSYEDTDPRLRLSRHQGRALNRVVRGESIAVISASCDVSPTRVRRWLKSPLFRKAVAAEQAHPTEALFGLKISLLGVMQANAAQREKPVARDKEGERDEED